MHVQVVSEEQAAVKVQNVQESSSDDVETDGFVQAALAGGDVDPDIIAQLEGAVGQPRRPVVKDADDWSNTPRNAPCPCGSGRKYKQCHGAA
ncbi:MAG: SEC-C metal-binding domain-containing protein [Actinomycetota bacterium]